jgi:hypothetical protein
MVAEFFFFSKTLIAQYPIDIGHRELMLPTLLAQCHVVLLVSRSE